jgi:hypothetical protein
MVINYIILAHKEPEQVCRLVERLSSVHTYFYIHIDRTVDIQPFKLLLKNKERVNLLSQEKRVATTWGSFGSIQATLNAINEVVKDNRHGYTILISGQCYPIKPNEYIYSTLALNYGYNFIEGFELPNARWPSSYVRLHHYAFYMSTKRKDIIILPPLPELELKNLFKKNIVKKYFKVILTNPLSFPMLLKKRKFPSGLKPYGGMAYWALPLDTLKFIIKFSIENAPYLKYHKYTLFSDEIFFQTIVHNYFEKVKLPTTFAHWADPTDPSPQILTTDHLPTLKEREEFFARKFDYDIDKKILDLIDSELLQQDQ